jgi:hypothetical protein
MNAKYPEAYGTCYRNIKASVVRVIGVREGFTGKWFVGYMDGKTRRKSYAGHPFGQVSNPDPAIMQAKLDDHAKEKGWEVAV